jgi:nucleotide-binding universal stress UspA family protein
MKKKKSRHRQPILVATDFSKGSEAALSWAVQHADSMKAGVTLLHVIHEPADQPGFYKKENKDVMRPLADIANRMMRKFLKGISKKTSKYKAFRRLETILVEGIPSTRIIEVANNLEARLVVLGTKGRAELADILIGSTAEKVVHHSPIPVVTIKDDQIKMKKSKEEKKAKS